MRKRNRGCGNRLSKRRRWKKKKKKRNLPLSSSTNLPKWRARLKKGKSLKIMRFLQDCKKLKAKGQLKILRKRNRFTTNSKIYS